MPEITTAGNQGEKVKDDCHVALGTNHGSGLQITVESPLGPEREKAVDALARNLLDFFEVTSAQIRIWDHGAPDFVVSARMEACIKVAFDSQKDFLPEMRPENRSATFKKRMRVSRLYVPGNSPRMMIKAGAGGSNAVILDLEDAVAAARKHEARLLVRNALRQVDFFGAERMVRINQLPLGLEDIDQIVPQGVNVILVPKCENAETVNLVNDRINRVRDAGGIFLMPIIESAKGIVYAEKIAAAADNIAALAIGLEDYTADLGVARTQEGTESFYARSHLVTVCKAYGIQAIDSVFSDVGDPDGLARTVARSKTLGFEGMGCIHPRQIDLIHQGYAPDPQEIEKAKKIISAFDEATKNGLGVVALGTKMIDPPVVERANQTIEKAIAFNLLSKDWQGGNPCTAGSD